MDNILNTITAYREERKWSLYDLAVHAEMKSTTISTWYNEDTIPSIPSLVKICDAFQSRVPIKQYLQKFPKWGRFGVTSVTPFLLLPVHPEGCTPAHRT